MTLPSKKEEKPEGVKRNSLTSKNPHIILKTSHKMNTVLHILSKILSTIWTIALIPLQLILAVLFALTLYVLIYALILGVILWLLTL